MVELVKEEIISEDVGNAEELLGDLREAVESAISPADEAEKEAEVEDEMDWSPVESKKIRTKLNQLSRSLSKLKNVEMYRNAGKTPYCAAKCGKNKGVACIYLSVKKTRVSLGEVEKSNGRTKGVFPKHLIWIVEEDGFKRDGESTTIKNLTQHVRSYIRDRGWA